MNPQFILIYCSENQALANKFSGDLSTSGASFIHVQADQQADMSRVLSSTTPAILLATDNFLKNKNCLYGAYSNYGQLIKTGRLLVVVAEGHVINKDGSITKIATNFERVSGIINYMNYWQDLYLAARKDKILSDTEINVLKDISAQVGDFVRQMKESNIQYYENLTARNYQQFCQMAGLPMPTTNATMGEIEAPKITQPIVNEPIVENIVVETIETPIILPSAVNEPEAVIPIIETPLVQKSEEETINEILDKIPNVLPTQNPLWEKALAAKEIDEDDFFNEKMPNLTNSNINEIMDEVVAEEETDAANLEEMGNADIEDIFDEDDAPETDDINDIFENITSRKSDEINIAPSEVNIIQSIANESLIENINTQKIEENVSTELANSFSESEEKIEEIAALNLSEIEENISTELTNSFSESEEKIEEIDVITESEEIANEMPSENSNVSAPSEDSAEDEEEQTSETTVMPSATLSSAERLQMALNFAKQQNFKGATAQLEEVLAENPNNPDAYFLLAEVSELNNDNYSAITFYEKVAELSAFYPKINQKLAHLYAENYPDKRKQTKKHFKKAIDLDEDNPDLLYAYAEFLNEDKEHPEKAIKYFKRVLKIAEGHPFANYDLAMLYHDLGEKSLASEYYLEACDNNPELATEANDDAFLNYHVLDVARAGEAINLHNPEEDEQLQPIEDEEFGELETLDSLIAAGVIAQAAGYENTLSEEGNIADTLVENSIEETPIVAEIAIETPVLTVVNEIDEAATYVAKPNKYKPQADAKIVLITGATAGIGKATAEIFARNGYNLILTGRREARLIEMQNEFHAKYSGGCIILDFDIRNLDNIKTTFENLNKDWLNIDILINNAGLALGMDPIHEGHFEHWDAMIDTNIKGLLYMTRMISPLMVARQSGHIINLCSTAGKEAYPNGNVYSATKFAVEALTRNMRIDLHKFGIRVGQVSPGAVEETEFSEVRFEGDTDRAAKIYEGFVPLRASDVADVIFYMASAPTHVNIQDVLVMGRQQASATIIDRSGREI